MNAPMFANRRENLARLVAERFDGNRSAMGRAAGVHQNQINLMLTDNEDHRRNMGEDLARRMERSLGLPMGYFDQERRPSILGDVVNIRGIELPEEYSGALRLDDEVHAFSVYSGWMLSLKDQITAPANLLLCRVATKDMEREGIGMGDHVVVDTGHKNIFTDGVYVIRHGSTALLRRIRSRVQGGWVVIEPDGAAVELQSTKSVKVIGRLLSTVSHKTI